jgi:hypothetical protein
VRREALEARILTAIREQVLVPEVVALATERVLEKVVAAMRKDDPAKIRKRLREIEGELENLARHVARTGDVEGAAKVVTELKQERSSLEARLAARPKLPDRNQVRRMAEARILEIKTALEGHDDQRRAALRSLLRGRFFKVGPDPEKLFRVTAELQLGAHHPRPTDGRAGISGRSGGALRTSGPTLPVEEATVALAA